MPTATNDRNPTASPFMPRKDVDRTFRSVRRKVDLVALNDDLISLQVERIVWLRIKEAESDKPLREVGAALRAIEPHLKRRERLDAEAAKLAPPEDAPKVTEVSEDMFRDMVEVYARRLVGAPQDPDVVHPLVQTLYPDGQLPDFLYTDWKHGAAEPPVTSEPALDDSPAADIAPELSADGPRTELTSAGTEEEPVEPNPPPDFVPDPNFDYIHELRLRNRLKQPTVDLGRAFWTAERRRRSG